MIQYLPKPYERSGGNIKVVFSNYARKDDVKDPAGADTSNLNIKIQFNYVERRSR